MPLSIKYDYRFDPFTEADQAIDISSEEKAVPSNTPYYVNLEEVPRQDSPSLITAYDVTGGLTLSEISGTPATGEFNVDYKYQTGKVRFNAAQAGNTIRFDYKGTGHVIAGTFINILSDWIGKNYTVENDHDHNSINSKAVDSTVIPRMLVSEPEETDEYSGGGSGADETARKFKIYLPAKTVKVRCYARCHYSAGETAGEIRFVFGSTDTITVTVSSSSYAWDNATGTLTVNAAAGGWFDLEVKPYNLTVDYDQFIKGLAVSFEDF